LNPGKFPNIWTYFGLAGSVKHRDLFLEFFRELTLNHFSRNKKI